MASALPADAILVEFVRFELFDFNAVPANGDIQWQPARYLAFVLPSGQPDAVQMIDLGSAQVIDQLVWVFRLQASDYSKATLGWGKADQLPKLPIKPYDSAPAIELSQVLVKPIYNALKGCKHLIFAPDGNLNLLPFQALPCDETNTRLLMDEFTISYLSVGRDILRRRSPPQGSQIPKLRPASTPLIIADPDFDLAAEQTDTSGAIAFESPLAIVKQQSSNDEFINTLDGEVLSRTLGTRFLAESVAKKLPDARLYLGAEALETHLTTSNCPSIMLIATHGLFLADSPQAPFQTMHLEVSKIENPMMRSGLALAGANTWLSGGILPPSAGKGFIFAQDIASLDLWANELTVLSACDTARGDIKIGEGVFGLRRAFAVAGTKTLVMSLWKVPDQATALLMERFFNNLDLNMGRAEALQNAQNYIRKITVKELRKSALGIEVLKQLLHVFDLLADTEIDCHESDTPLEHPFYWGAWICQGDTTRMHNFKSI
ncbi:CHAT domain-containing protein [Nostoc sp.]|uniref:CHAT domain-containing protein n=1 Tax=Nostoc sp. TaxID=1180 RepID=UPI002FFC42E6